MRLADPQGVAILAAHGVPAARVVPDLEQLRTVTSMRTGDQVHVVADL
ncbi:hypothetical protein [Angustibacter luteus]|uniref:Uncharacterized protein n=1 Tax=Angustibacter luteus TaxID=658456 RepID=A0ABW1JKW1_9ACTN